MPPANRPGDQFDTLVVVRHKPVLEDSLKPSRLCRVSGRNGGQSTDGPSLVRGLWGRGDSGKNCPPPLLTFASWNYGANAIAPSPSVISAGLFYSHSSALISGVVA